MVDDTLGEAPQKKKGGMVMTIAAVAIVTVVAAAGGWFLGGFLAPVVNQPKKPPPVAAEAGKKPDEGLPMLTALETEVVQLEPITSNLAFPSNAWVRLEVAVLFKDKADPKIAETVHQDILLYLRTVTLQQIEGPRGFQYLKEDLESRADLISEGKVAQLLFRTFVIE